MRIGIIATARSGGHNLGEWLSNELDSKYIHEPLLNGLHTDGRNIVVKWLINEWEKLDTKPVMDKWIGLVRMDSRDCAISHLRAEQSGEWHIPYTLTDEWIQQNETHIENMGQWVEQLNHKVSTEINEIQLMISYEGIYHTGEDIQRLIDYIGIETPLYLHMLNKSNRLRNKIIKPKTLI
jgi:hypothetical protein